MNATERLDAVIAREQESSQTFEDLEKSQNPNPQQPNAEEPKVVDNDHPNTPEPNVTGEGGAETPVEAEKAGATGGQQTPNEPSVEKKDNENPNDKGHSPEEQRKYTWQKLRNENKEFKAKNEALNTQIKQLQEQIAKFKEEQPSEQQYTEENFRSKEDYFRYLAHQQYQQDSKQAQQQQAEQALANLQEQQRAMTILQREEALFPAEQRKQYCDVVNAAMEAGMSNALNANPDVMEFLDNSEMAPRLLYHFALKPEDFFNIVNNPNPTSRKFALARLEEGLYRTFVLNKGAAQPNNGGEAQPPKNSDVPNQTPPKKQVPIIGKIGEGGDKSNSDTASEAEIMKSYRKYTA